MSTYTNLVFKGGGVKGVAYAGALLQLEAFNILPDIKRVAGTSAGAITAALLAVGYTPAEIKEIVLHDMDFESFMDKKWFPADIFQFLKKFGWYKGDAFKEWLGEKIKAKTGSELTDFYDLNNLVAKHPDKFKKLYVVATNLNRQYFEVFSAEKNDSTPIVDAVRMSMGIPFFFKSVKWNSYIMVDGGMAYNYPIDMFDDPKYVADLANLKEEKLGAGTIKINYETLGFWLDTKADIDNLRNQSPKPPIKIATLRGFTFSLVDYLMEMANSAHLEEYDWNRSILIDSLDVKATDFKGVKDKAPALIKSGEKGVIDYFKVVNPSLAAMGKVMVN